MRISWSETINTQVTTINQTSTWRLQYQKAAPAKKGYQVLMDLVDMNLTVLNGKDPSDLDQSIRKTLNDDIETWSNKYRTFQGPYSAEMITELMEVAGKNISNNREKLLEQIQAVMK
ncbi:hypothetical protein cypCar_00046981 [Cyprinus carpio]|nr:hypothetical protein cypCar_00046981 [Cyprinus carpio]